MRAGSASDSEYDFIEIDTLTSSHLSTWVCWRLRTRTWELNRSSYLHHTPHESLLCLLSCSSRKGNGPRTLTIEEFINSISYRISTPTEGELDDGIRFSMGFPEDDGSFRLAAGWWFVFSETRTLYTMVDHHWKLLTYINAQATWNACSVDTD